MPDNVREQTINEEAGLPENWVPVDAPPIVPGRTPMGIGTNSGSNRFRQGSLPPGYQHDSSFVDNAFDSPNAPNLSMMPLGASGNPAVNSSIQSTSSVTPSSVAPVTATTLTINVPPALFSPAYYDITLPGSVTLTFASIPANQVFAGPTTGAAASPLFRSLVVADFPTIDVPHGGTGDTTLAAHGVLVGNGTSPVNVTTPGTAGQVLTSNGASADPTFQSPAVPSPVVEINGAGTAIDKQFYMNGVTDGAAVWAVSINGTPDGG